MALSWQEYWSELLFPPLRGLPNPGIEPASPVAPELAGRLLAQDLHLGASPMAQMGKECASNAGHVATHKYTAFSFTTSEQFLGAL